MKSAGIDEVLVMCVNDAAVMGAWAKDQKIEGSQTSHSLPIQTRTVTKASGRGVDGTRVRVRNLDRRDVRRFAMYVEDGIVKVINVSEAPDDPAGDDRPESSCIDNMLKDIAAL